MSPILDKSMNLTLDTQLKPSKSAEICGDTSDLSKSSKIRKQISLYEEKDYSTEYKQLSQDLAKFTRGPSKGNVIKRWTEATEQQSSHISADSIQSTAIVKLDPKKDDGKNTKTMSCMNLKSCTANNPGAIVVKEKFIEPPVRVAKSFHGNTSFLTKFHRQDRSQDLESTSSTSSSTDSVFKIKTATSNAKHRFIATKVDEPILNVTKPSKSNESETGDEDKK